MNYQGEKNISSKDEELKELVLDPSKLRTPCNGDFFTQDSRGGKYFPTHRIYNEVVRAIGTRRRDIICFKNGGTKDELS
jgi:hypothetical protein